MKGVLLGMKRTGEQRRCLDVGSNNAGNWYSVVENRERRACGVKKAAGLPAFEGGRLNDEFYSTNKGAGGSDGT